MEEGAVLFENGKILAAGKVLAPEGAELIDAKGAYAGPGYVDIHCHGGGTVRVEEDPAGMAGYHLQYGTTSLCCGLSYSLTREEMFGGIELVKDAMKNPETSIVGIHFEGPYTNPKHGATSTKAWKLDRDEYHRLFEQSKGLVRQVTYAPELPGIEEFEQYVHSLGIPLAVGHTEMSPAILDRAVRSGATIVTHLFDAMGCWRGNESIDETGIIQDSAADAALARDDLFVEIICDEKAVHVKPSNLKLALRAAGVDKVVLITDSVTRKYDYTQYPPEDKRSSRDLNYNELGELSGSMLTMEGATQNMMRHTGASVEDIFKMASRNPAQAVLIDDKVGSLEAGKRADIILCDGSMKISGIYHLGKKVR